MDLYPTPSLSRIIFSDPSSPSTPSSFPSTWSFSSSSLLSFLVSHEAVPIPFYSLTAASVTHFFHFASLSKGVYKLVFSFFATPTMTPAKHVMETTVIGIVAQFLCTHNSPVIALIQWRVFDGLLPGKVEHFSELRKTHRQIPETGEFPMSILFTSLEKRMQTGYGLVGPLELEPPPMGPPESGS